MKYLVWSLIILAALAVYTSLAYCDSIGITAGQAGDDWSAGAVGELEHDFGLIDADVNAQIQLGDLHRFNVHADLTADLGKVGLKLPIDITAEHYEIAFDGLSRDANIFLALTVPYEGVNIDIGFGGKSAAPWSPSPEDQALIDAGLRDPETTLDFENESSLMLMGAFELDWNGVEVKERLVFGSTNDMGYMQSITRFNANKALSDRVDMNIGLEVKYSRQGGEEDIDTALSAGVNIPF